RIPRAYLDRHFSKKQPSITVLIPSYSEEPDVIYKTMLSAALQEYPVMRIVLLMDDKPFSTDPAVTARLEKTRGLARKIEKLLGKPSKRFKAALAEFETTSTKKLTTAQQRKLIREYNWAVDWLNSQADGMAIQDHVDMFFADEVFRGLARELQLT